MSEGSLPPTPKRLEKARREGDFGSTGAPGSALALFAAVLVLPALGAVVASDLRVSIRSAVAYAAMASPDALVVGPRSLAHAVLAIALPIVVLLAVVAATSTLIETRFGFAPSRLLGKTSRKDRPFFGPFARGLVSALLGLVVTIAALRASAIGVAHMTALSADGALARVPALVVVMLRAGVAIAFVAAIGSTVVAVRAHRQRLQMTPRQIEDERKQGDGDPEVKAARKRVAEMVFSVIPLRGLPRETTACVFNHEVAVVVSWAKDVDAAPRLVRKLRGVDADRLAQEALSEAISTIYDDDLAARIYVLVATGHELPEALYDPVAALFAASGDRAVTSSS